MVEPPDAVILGDVSISPDDFNMMEGPGAGTDGRQSTVLVYAVGSTSRTLRPTAIPRVSPASRKSKQPRTPYEDFILSCIDGRRKVKDVVRVSGLSSEDVIVTMMTLLDKKLIIVDDKPAKKKPPKSKHPPRKISIDRPSNVRERAKEDPTTELPPPVSRKDLKASGRSKKRSSARRKRVARPSADPIQAPSTRMSAPVPTAPSQRENLPAVNPFLEQDTQLAPLPVPSVVAAQPSPEPPPLRPPISEAETDSKGEPKSKASKKKSKRKATPKSKGSKEKSKRRKVRARRGKTSAPAAAPVDEHLIECEIKTQVPEIVAVEPDPPTHSDESSATPHPQDKLTKPPVGGMPEPSTRAPKNASSQPDSAPLLVDDMFASLDDSTVGLSRPDPAPEPRSALEHHSRPLPRLPSDALIPKSDTHSVEDAVAAAVAELNDDLAPSGKSGPTNGAKASRSSAPSPAADDDMALVMEDPLDMLASGEHENSSGPGDGLFAAPPPMFEGSAPPPRLDTQFIQPVIAQPPAQQAPPAASPPADIVPKSSRVTGRGNGRKRRGAIQELDRRRERPAPKGQKPEEPEAVAIPSTPVVQAEKSVKVDGVRMAKADKLFNEALKDKADGNLVSARMNMKLALTFDPTNPMYVRAYEELSIMAPTGSNIINKARQNYALATTAEKEGRIDEAVQLLEDALIEKRDPHVLNRLGVLLAMKKFEFTRAIQLIEEAIRRAPKNATYAHNLQKVLQLAASHDYDQRHAADTSKKKGLLGLFRRKK